LGGRASVMSGASLVVVVCGDGGGCDICMCGGVLDLCTVTSGGDGWCSVCVDVVGMIDISLRFDVQ
jgi:hypothetical protein